MVFYKVLSIVSAILLLIAILLLLFLTPIFIASHMGEAATGLIGFVCVLVILLFLTYWSVTWLTYVLRDVIFLRMKRDRIVRILKVDSLLDAKLMEHLTPTRMLLYIAAIVTPMVVVTRIQSSIDPRQYPEFLVLSMCVPSFFFCLYLGNLVSRILLDTLKHQNDLRGVRFNRRRMASEVAKERQGLLYSTVPSFLGWGIVLVMLVYLIAPILASTAGWYPPEVAGDFLLIVASAGELVRVVIPIWFVSLASTYVLGYYLIPAAQLLGYRIPAAAILAFLVMFLIDRFAPGLLEVFFPPFVPSAIIALVTFAFVYALTSGIERTLREFQD
jgi:hypothetical protein